jgi:hypothetical protein
MNLMLKFIMTIKNTVFGGIHMKKVIAIISILILALALFSGCFGKKTQPADKVQEEKKVEKNQTEQNKPAQQPIVAQTDERSFAVMIDNEGKARARHEGLDKAYIIYEMVAEGGETRLMALFKGTNPTAIGPVRSARHYFVHYALENDAVFVHFGWSPLAQKAIPQLGVNNINGISGTDGSSFWRKPKSKYDWQNAFTSMEKLKERAAKKGYSNTTQVQEFAYNSVDTDLVSGASANNVKLKYNNYRNVEYVYDAASKLYKRFQGSKAHTDTSGKIQYSAKNIIISFVKSYDLNDGPDTNGVNKGRQQVNDVGEGKGYLITNGKSIEITWKKSSLKAKTEYRDMSGKEITLNNGQTWIQLAPSASKVTIE